MKKCTFYKTIYVVIIRFSTYNQNIIKFREVQTDSEECNMPV